MRTKLFILILLCTAAVSRAGSVSSSRKIKNPSIGAMKIYCLGGRDQYATLQHKPRGYVFPYGIQFERANEPGVPIEMGGIKVSVSGQGFWGSFEAPPNYYLLENQKELNIPKCIRTGQGGMAVLPITINRAEWGGLSSFWYIRLAEVRISGPTGIHEITVYQHERAPDSIPGYWEKLLDGFASRIGFYAGGCASGFQWTRHADWRPIAPPNAPPGRPGVCSVEPVSFLRSCIGEGVLLSSGESAFLNVSPDYAEPGFRVSGIDWMYVGNVPDPNDSIAFLDQAQAKKIDYFSFPLDTHEPNEIRNYANLYFPSIQIESAPVGIKGREFTGYFVVPGMMADPNTDPNLILPVTFEVFDSNFDCTRHIIRPKNVYIALVDPNCPPESGFNPYFVPFDEIGAQILIVPGYKDREIGVRLETNWSILFSLIDFWLSDNTALDLDKSGRVDMGDLSYYATNYIQ